MNNSITVAELITGRKTQKTLKIRDTGYECTAYFGGRDGKGTCCTRCQWWCEKYECPCAKGSKFYDGLCG